MTYIMHTFAKKLRCIIQVLYEYKKQTQPIKKTKYLRICFNTTTKTTDKKYSKKTT